MDLCRVARELPGHVALVALCRDASRWLPYLCQGLDVVHALTGAAQARDMPAMRPSARGVTDAALAVALAAAEPRGTPLSGAPLLPDDPLPVEAVVAGQWAVPTLASGCHGMVSLRADALALAAWAVPAALCGTRAPPQWLQLGAALAQYADADAFLEALFDGTRNVAADVAPRLRALAAAAMAAQAERAEGGKGGDSAHALERLGNEVAVVSGATWRLVRVLEALAGYADSVEVRRLLLEKRRARLVLLALVEAMRLAEVRPARGTVWPEVTPAGMAVLREHRTVAAELAAIARVVGDDDFATLEVVLASLAKRALEATAALVSPDEPAEWLDVLREDEGEATAEEGVAAIVRCVGGCLARAIAPGADREVLMAALQCTVSLGDDMGARGRMMECAAPAVAVLLTSSDDDGVDSLTASQCTALVRAMGTLSFHSEHCPASDNGRFARALLAVIKARKVSADGVWAAAAAIEVAIENVDENVSRDITALRQTGGVLEALHKYADDKSRPMVAAAQPMMTL